MASEYSEVPFDLIDEDPRNIRRSYSGIDQLAYTIHEHGLLQNLLLIREGERFFCKDGNRRRRAIKLLIDKGLWDKSKGIPSLILDSEGDFEQVIADVQKQEAPIWHLGFRFNEWSDSGLNQGEIATRIGRSRGYVSRAQNVSANLAPDTIKKLDSLPFKALTAEQVYRVSMLINPVTKKPDVQAQSAKIDAFLNLPRSVTKHKSKHKKNSELSLRFYKLKGKLKIPAHAIAYVQPIIDYLEGHSTRLTFPKV